jgi:hypothetical protein
VKEEPGREFIPAIETHLIHSQYVDQTFKVQVMQPARGRHSTGRFPVVYATDGNFAFDALKGISYSIQTYTRDAPRYLLVGIGYPSDSPVAGYQLRARDMTFPGYPEFAVNRFPMEDVLLPEADAKHACGADDFHRFIERELIAQIEERYPASPAERTYFGHSLGGSFGLYTLFTKSELFRNYIISSPAVIYHGESSAGIHYDDYDFVLREARKFVASGKSLDGVRMYISVGAQEELEPEYAQWRFVSSFERLVKLVKNGAIPGLELTTETFADEAHMTVWPMAFIHGIQAVFGTRARR